MAVLGGQGEIIWVEVLGGRGETVYVAVLVVGGVRLFGWKF